MQNSNSTAFIIALDRRSLDSSLHSSRSSVPAEFEMIFFCEMNYAIVVEPTQRHCGSVWNDVIWGEMLNGKSVKAFLPNATATDRISDVRNSALSTFSRDYQHSDDGSAQLCTDASLCAFLQKYCISPQPKKHTRRRIRNTKSSLNKRETAHRRKYI